jgi:hypothetical protein
VCGEVGADELNSIGQVRWKVAIDAIGGGGLGNVDRV